MRSIRYAEEFKVGVPPSGGECRKWPAKAGTPAVLAGILLLLLMTGCATDHRRCGSCPDACPDFCEANCIPETAGQTASQVSLADWQRCVQPLPSDAVPAPPGTYVTAWREAHAAGAMQRHWVVTRNLWFSGGDQLSEGGTQQLARIAAAMQESQNWVVIETQPVLPERGETYQEAKQKIDQLQQLRRQVVVDALARDGVPDADQWVIFADDRNVGVRGIEAPQIFNRQFQSFSGANQGNQGNGNRSGNGGLGGGIGGGGLSSGGFGGGGIF